MGNPVTGIAPLDYVKVFFRAFSFPHLPNFSSRSPTLTKSTEEERLPYAEGWRPPTTQTNLLTLGSLVLQLNAANGEILHEGLTFTTNTLKLAFGGYDPMTGLLVHVL
jgi:hypothetical protein